MEEYFIGIDLHRDFFVAVAQDAAGTEVFRKRYENSIASVEDLVSQFKNPPLVVVEATRNWMWFIALLQKKGCTVQLAHPFRTKAIASARIKTDSIDAKTLCDLLRANLIPQSYIASIKLLASEIGDIKRFPNSKKFASYFGLVPRLSQSGNHAYYGRITKLGNPYVRWILGQASHRLVRADTNYKRFVDRLSFRHGKKKAIVALSRKLATIVYAVLKENRAYEKKHTPINLVKVCPASIPERS